QGFRRIQQFFTQMLHQQAGQLGVGLVEPAPEGHAVGLVVDAVGIQAMQVAEHGVAHQFGVQRGDAVDTMGAQKSQVAHAHAAALVLFDQRHGAQQGEIVNVLGAQHVDVVRVDQINDLHVPGQQATRLNSSHVKISYAVFCLKKKKTQTEK